MSFSLNPEQEQAATTLSRPVVVTAGAGSGKTRMLTQRLINAVVPGAVEGWSPADMNEIVAITFTEKAAGELAERVRGALRDAGQEDAARAVDSAWLSTIHGLCSRLLRRHALEAGIDPLFGVAESVHAGQLREEAFESAAIALLEEYADTPALFDAYSYVQLYQAAVSVSRQLAVRGLSADALLCEEGRTTDALIDQAAELFSHGTTACSGYGGTAKTAGEFTERCEQLLSEVQSLTQAASDDSERLTALAALLGRHKPLKRALKGIEEECAETVRLYDELTAAVGAALVAPYGPALSRLIGRYTENYAALKAAASVLDFDDLQVKAVELLERDATLAKRYRDQFRLVMIDEFQDTDALQLRLVEALSDGDLCTVGDEKQSIYRFRGADIGVYREHRTRMAANNAETISLGVNYRSHPEVLAFVNAVFSAEQYFAGDLLRLEPPDGTREGRPIDAALGERPHVEALFVDASQLDTAGGRRAEAAALAARFAELTAAGVGPGDMAILSRRYTDAHVYADALSRVGIPAVIIGGSRFFGLEEVSALRALVRAIANPSDGTAIGELLISEFCDVSDDALALMRVTDAGRDKTPLCETLRAAGDRLADDDRAAADRLIAALTDARAEVGSRPLGDIILRAVEHVGYDLRLLSKGNAGRDAFANVLKFARQATRFEAENGGGPAAFSANLDAKELIGEGESPAAVADTGEGAVRIMSVHASKGLEFPVVAVVDLASGGRGNNPFVRTSPQPNGMRMALSAPSTDGADKLPKSAWWTELAEEDKQAEAEEGNRVLYVACTRARDLLIVSGSMNLRPKSGTTARHHLARLAEILGVEIPITGTQDLEASPRDAGSGEAARCRVRVVDGTDYVPAEAAEDLAATAAKPTAPTAVSGAAHLEGFPAPSPESLFPRRMSYSTIALFERCPRRYFAEVVLGLSRVEIARPGETTATQFGSALHAVLQLVDMQGSLPSEERIAALARHAELDAEQQARLRAAAARFVSSPLAQRVSGSARVAREMPFAVPLSAGTCLLRGSIDLYARTADSALIIDYKSGTSGTAEELSDRYGLQARCYGLAALVDGATDVDVVFVRPEVDGGAGALEQVSFTFTPADEASIRRELESAHDRIGTSSFAPIGERDESVCRECAAPSGLCPHARS